MSTLEQAPDWTDFPPGPEVMMWLVAWQEVEDARTTLRGFNVTLGPEDWRKRKMIWERG